ncbi:MAG: O-antigen ligase family protein [Clostridia bacterium]|jgi:O-antigen ligase
MLRIRCTRRDAILVLLWASLICLLIYYSSFYYRINVPIITSLGRLIFYLGIDLAFILAVTLPRGYKNGAISIFCAFQVWAVISTIIANYTADGPLWKQIIYMSSFVACLVTSYRCATGLEYDRIIKTSNFFIVLFSLVFIALVSQNVYGTLMIHNNTVYYIALCLPFVGCLKNKIIRYSLFGVIGTLIVVSMKRTAFLAYILFLLVLYLYRTITEKEPHYLRMIVMGVLISAGLLIGYTTIMQRYGTNLLSTLSISAIREDQGSNRFYIYSQVWEAQKKASIIHWIFGYGYNGVWASRVATDGYLGEFVSAHNDILEVLYDYGIVGFVMYASFIVKLVREALLSVKIKAEYAAPFIASLAILFVFSMTSHLIIYYNYFGIMLVFWGICFAENRRFYAEFHKGINNSSSL